MQFIKQTWSKSRRGKATIGCASLLLLCSLCTAGSMIWSATPQGRQATVHRNATATTSALIRLSTVSAATALPTVTLASTNTPAANNTPHPAATTSSAISTVIPAETGGANLFTCAGGCAVPPDPSCAIKGNVNSEGEKIYHTPDQRDYERTDIKPEDGDRWFCTEEEAKAAGFRPAER